MSSTQGENRRRWTRDRIESTQVILDVNHYSVPAEVVDESFGGVGLDVDAATEFTVGQDVLLMYLGAPVSGRVCYVADQSTGKRRVGVQWNCRPEQNPSTPVARCDEATYLPFSGLCIRCEVVDYTSDGYVRVLLPDHSHVSVRPEWLQTESFDDRWIDLKNLGLGLTMLGGFYQLGQHATREELIQAILDFEFAVMRA